MQYYELPADIIEDADALRTWADAAIAVTRISATEEAVNDSVDLAALSSASRCGTLAGS